MGSLKYCDITCSWASQDSKSIHDAVVYRSEDSSDDNLPPLNSFGVTLEPDLANKELKDGDNKMDADSRENFPAPCMLSLTCRNPPYLINVAAVDILSESKTMEVYGAHGEYLETCHGLPLEINDGRKLYLCQHSFTESVNRCSMKLLSAVKKEELWLQSLHITVNAATSTSKLSSLVTPTIDMNKVNSMLADMGARIPDGAQNLMDTMETMQKNRESTIGAMEGMLNAMIGVNAPVSMLELQRGDNNSDGAMPSALASMMAMFAGMKPNSTDVEHKTFKEQHKSEKSTVCETEPLTAVGASSECQSLTAKVDNALLGVPPQASTSCDEETGFSPNDSEGQTDTYQIIYQHITGMEQRLKQYISQKVAESEQRIQSKLDRILAVIQQGQSESNKSSASSKLPDDLTLD